MINKVMKVLTGMTAAPKSKRCVVIRVADATAGSGIKPLECIRAVYCRGELAGLCHSVKYFQIFNQKNIELRLIKFISYPGPS